METWRHFKRNVPSNLSCIVRLQVLLGKHRQVNLDACSAAELTACPGAQNGNADEPLLGAPLICRLNDTGHRRCEGFPHWRCRRPCSKLPHRLASHDYDLLRSFPAEAPCESLPLSPLLGGRCCRHSPQAPRLLAPLVLAHRPSKGCTAGATSIAR